MQISKEIGDIKIEVSVNGSLGTVHQSLGDLTTAKKYFQKSRAIAKRIGCKTEEGIALGNLGRLHTSLDEYAMARKCCEQALEISKQTVHKRVEIAINQNLGALHIHLNELQEALKCFQRALLICEQIGDVHWKNMVNCNIAGVYIMRQDIPKALSYLSESIKNLEEARVSVGESEYYKIGTGRIEVVTNKGLPADIQPQGASIQDWLENLANQSYRKFLLLQEEHCEDRSLLLWDENSDSTFPSKVEEGVSTSQVTEQKEEGDKKPPALKDLYNIIVAPVLKFLEGSEIIVVPDRSLYKIPFAALMDENGEYLSEKFMIRFIPSLTSLKLIQESPANYHSQTGVLIVGDPEVGLPELCSPLPCAREEAEMIGRLLHACPFTGRQATKQAVLQKIRSVSLIHIAAHGNADRGDIALAPAQHIKGEPKKEDFVLTMHDISRKQLRAKLMVLSCCHSGRGQIKAEGVVGIARAFLGSGAFRIWCTLRVGVSVGCGRQCNDAVHEAILWTLGPWEKCRNQVPEGNKRNLTRQIVIHRVVKGLQKGTKVKSITVHVQITFNLILNLTKDI
ncbi:hypothetical protein ACROYT_G000746 [Oculina patagonica]